MADDHDERHRGAEHASPYGLSRLAPSITLVDVAAEIQHADTMIGTVAHSKLKVIAEQIRLLQERARDVLESAKLDLDLHRAKCAFPRRPGKVYHLYAKADDDLYWSMVSPEEWGDNPPHPFVGSYRLGADQSWTAVGDEVESEVPDEREIVRALLSDT